MSPTRKGSEPPFADKAAIEAERRKAATAARIKK